jgi:hypothetical protein
VFLDEIGFSPSLPVCRSWALPGCRPTIYHESSHHQRVNAMAGLIAHGPATSLTWMTETRTWVDHDVLHLIEHGIPRDGRRLIVVLDNAGIHRSRVIQAERPRLRRLGIHFFYLPPYAPELNLIESHFGVIKHHDLPERTYLDINTLRVKVEEAFSRSEQRLWARTQ